MPPKPQKQPEQNFQPDLQQQPQQQWSPNAQAQPEQNFQNSPDEAPAAQKTLKPVNQLDSDLQWQQVDVRSKPLEENSLIWQDMFAILFVLAAIVSLLILAIQPVPLPNNKRPPTQPAGVSTPIDVTSTTPSSRDATELPTTYPTKDDQEDGDPERPDATDTSTPTSITSPINLSRTSTSEDTGADLNP